MIKNGPIVKKNGEIKIMKRNKKKLWTISIILLILLPIMSMPIIAIEKSVIFDMPCSVVIGDELFIGGMASVGNTVDIAIDGVVIPELNDVALDEFGAFRVLIDTVATYSPGSLKRPRPVKIEAFINRARGVGTIGPDEDNDGSTLILMVQGGLIVELSTNMVNRSDSFVISGDAPGSRQLEVLTISPRGGEAGKYGIRENTGTNYTGITYDKVSVSRTDHTYSKEFHVSDTAYTGTYFVVVLSYGIDGVYGDTDRSNIIGAINQKYNNPNLRSMSQDYILSLILGASINSTVSDDLSMVMQLAVKAPKSYVVRLDPIEDVVVGELLKVTGTSDKKEGSEIIITVEGLIGEQLMPTMVRVENGKFSATFDTDYALMGKYTVVAADGEGNTDEATVNLIPVPTPSPMVTVTPTESTPTPATPSFETIFAIAGLLAVAYLLKRRQ